MRKCIFGSHHQSELIALQCGRIYKDAEISQNSRTRRASPAAFNVAASIKMRKFILEYIGTRNGKAFNVAASIKMRKFFPAQVGPSMI